jgi:hypothetical protein
MSKSRRTNLNYLVVREVVADGKTVPCGDYRGLKIELGVPYQGQIVWQKPEYMLELPIQDGIFVRRGGRDGCNPDSLGQSSNFRVGRPVNGCRRRCRIP